MGLADLRRELEEIDAKRREIIAQAAAELGEAELLIEALRNPPRYASEAASEERDATDDEGGKGRFQPGVVQGKVRETVREHAPVTLRDVCNEHPDVNEGSIDNALKRLCEKGEIELVPNSKPMAYRMRGSQ